MEKISKTEIKVTHLIAQGYSEKEIASKLFRSTHTIHTHYKNIRKKLGARNIADITRIYMLHILPSANDVLKVFSVAFLLGLQTHIIFYEKNVDMRKARSSKTRIVKSKTKQFYV